MWTNEATLDMLDFLSHDHLEGRIGFLRPDVVIPASCQKLPLLTPFSHDYQLICIILQSFSLTLSNTRAEIDRNWSYTVTLAVLTL